MIEQQRQYLKKNRVLILFIIIVISILFLLVLNYHGGVNRNQNDGKIVRIEGIGDVSHTYLIVNGPKSLLVDCGSIEIVDRITKTLPDNNLRPSDVYMIILTHTHFDHVRGVDHLKKHLKEAKVLVHVREEERLIQGYSPLPPPTGHSSIWNSSLYGEEYYIIPKIQPDFVMKEDTVSLNTQEFGFIDGKIIWTPGHSAGSISIQIGEDILVGDTIEGIGGHTFVSFADDLSDLKKSWERILSLEGLENLHPSHGETYELSVMEKDFQRFSEIENVRRH